MAAGQGYNPAAAGPSRPDAQDFIPGNNYYNMNNTHVQDGFFGYVDPDMLNDHLNGSSAPPAAMMLAPPAQPVTAREPPFTRDTTAGLHDRHRAGNGHGSASVVATEGDGRGPPQPPPPPALTNVDGLRCPSPSLHQLRSDVEAVHDRLVRNGKRIDSMER